MLADAIELRWNRVAVSQPWLHFKARFYYFLFSRIFFLLALLDLFLNCAYVVFILMLYYTFELSFFTDLYCFRKQAFPLLFHSRSACQNVFLLCLPFCVFRLVLIFIPSHAPLKWQRASSALLRRPLASEKVLSIY